MFGLLLILPQLWTLTLKQDDSPWRGARLGGDTEGKEERWRADLEKAFRMGRPHPVVFLQFQLRRSGNGRREPRDGDETRMAQS